MQALADAAGQLIWASAALPGSVHDLTIARNHGLIDTLTSATY
ncbi:DDE superfamily endonuclease [Micromonospora echinaurantiaca]|uniref:DDE superfamily endonuclease n=1 Tax=Micromonospora echinaurantiaca TaxID=47857 RepID=A0A1C5IGP4_9ACTN|nr:DDE superfamily endonuclease [Micromonospora echinaurantiaca]